MRLQHPRIQAPASHRGRRLTHSGFTLLEVVVAMAVMLIAMLSLTSTSLVVHSMDQAEKERRLAVSGLSRTVEQLRARSALAIDSDLGWGVALTDDYALGGPLGPNFNIPGLDPWIDGAPVGTVQIVSDETALDLDLGVQLGMARDLNADGLVASNDVRVDAQLLPAIVRVRWRGSAGNREIIQGIWVARM